MDPASKVPRLVNEGGAVSAASLEEAAHTVGSFVSDLSGNSLDLVLAMAKAPRKETAGEASDLARSVTQNSGVLQDEVRRFLSLVARS